MERLRPDPLLVLGLSLSEEPDTSFVIGCVAAAAVIQLAYYVNYRVQLKKYTTGKYFRMAQAILVEQKDESSCDDGPDTYYLIFRQDGETSTLKKEVSSEFYQSVALGDAFYLAIHRNKKGKEVIGGCYPTGSYIPDPQVADILRRCANAKS